MKKIFAAILSSALILSLAACGSKTITMQEVYDAYQLDTILETHENVHIKYQLDDELSTDMYLTKEFSYEYFHDDTESWATYLTDDSYYGYEDGVYYRVVFLEENGLFDTASYRADLYTSPILSPFTMKEEIQSVTTKDGRITVSTVMSQEGLKEVQVLDEGLISGSYEYVMDAKTLTPIQSTGVDSYDDGTDSTFDFTCTYDEEFPAELQGFLELDRQTEDLRTITYVIHSETGEETTTSIQVPKGIRVDLIADYDVAGELNLYSDAACTEPFVNSEDYTLDLTLHVKWIK